jgi:hypothetical protein
MGDLKQPVSRRFALGALSVLAGSATVCVGEGGASAATPVSSAADLLRPLRPGSPFGRWRLERIGALDQGALVVTVSGAHGSFELEVLARDASDGMLRAPARTTHFAVHVVNEGDGSSPTAEDHGLCAMTLAGFIAKNESAAAARGFATLAHRLDLERRGLLRRP